MKKFVSCLLAVVMLFTVVAFSVSAEEGNVARMWLCSEASTNTGIGHIFLYFENLTDETITVGKYEVAPYGNVSVGCFGTEGTKGAGVYYNLETYLDHYHKLIGISADLTESELEATNKKMNSFDRWDPIFNCNYFALLGWNAGSDSDIPFLIFPGFTRIFIQLKGGIANPYDPYVRTDPIVKQSDL